MNTIILIILLLAEVIVAYILFDKDIMSPGVIFPGVFLFAAMDLLSMMGVWKTDIHFNTVLIIAGGCMTFVCASFLASRRETYRLPTIIPNYSATNELKISVQWLFLFLNIFIIIFVARKIMAVVAAAGFEKGVLASFGTYSYLSKFGNVNIGIGRLASNLYQFAQAETCFWGYLLVDKWYNNKKLPVLILGNYLITTLCYFLVGSRTGAVFSVIGLLPMLVIQYRVHTGKKNLSKKYIIILVAIVAFLLFSFQLMGEIIDRRLEGVGLWEYLSIYIGAPILNLDTFIQEPKTIPTVWGYNTFANQINYIWTKLGMEGYHLDIPFRSINGHNLGNVYTTFYSYLYDFGVIGMVILVFIMGYFIQRLYKRATKDISQNHGITLSILVFECLIPCIVFSFFSNKFYEQFNIAFVKGLFYWIILPRLLFFERKKK